MTSTPGLPRRSENAVVFVAHSLFCESESLMNFLRIAFFVVFLIGVIVWRNWSPTTAENLTQSQPSLIQNSPSDANFAGADRLIIDGHAILAVASLRNPQIVDGDSIRANGINGPIDFRLASIDAPELRQPFGQRAKKYLQAITAGKELTAYQTDTDQYGRRVAFVFTTVPGQNGSAEELNAKMIADGYAWHAIKHSQNSNLTRLEATARAASLGLWDQANPVPPWEFRDLQQQRIGSARIGL